MDREERISKLKKLHASIHGLRDTISESQDVLAEYINDFPDWGSLMGMMITANKEHSSANGRFFRVIAHAKGSREGLKLELFFHNDNGQYVSRDDILKTVQDQNLELTSIDLIQELEGNDFMTYIGNN